ncbi:MAG: glutathione S-transferase N-terminal domain-containing protein [Pseudomonadota bacterium]|nr:glutathione S-transferase [Pseudomonadales bacterium]MDY6920944.1 glutathione S-transferase N-terminal domain-containing protein [Pseudomonadota bacterium]
MSLTLYQFPISHFCEKARWALDFKALDYTTKNLLPGQHVKVIRRLAAQSSVPVLEHEGRSIQGSEQILTYLDEKFPARKLTPVNSGEAQAALEWERYLDKEIGVHVRRYVYQTLLQHPSLVTGFFATGGPFWWRPWLRLIYPKLVTVMRKRMNINPATAAESKQRVLMALERLNDSVGDSGYLVGAGFSRADLTAAALLAPLFMPPQYGLNWPAALPEPLHSEVAALEPQLQWARDIYARYRGA